MKNILLRVGVLVAIAAIAATPVMAQPGSGRGGGGPGSFRGGGGGPGGMGGVIMRSLNLTDAQRGQMMGRRLEREKMWKQAEEAMAEKDELRAMMQDPQSSEGEMRAQLKRSIDAQTKFHEMRINNLLALRKILTPDQLREMFARIDEMRGQRGGCVGGSSRGAMRGGPGGGGLGARKPGGGPRSRNAPPPADPEDSMLDEIAE